MNRRRSFRLVMLALIPITAISLGFGMALAQSPARAPGASPPPAGSTKPDAPPTATPGAATPSPTPPTPPVAAETPAAPPAAAPAPVQTADPFGEQITLEPKMVVVLRGNANWDSAFDSLIESFKSLSAL